MASHEIQLKLTGVKCAGCVGKIEKALLAVPGVEQASVNFPDRTASVSGTPANTALVTAITAAGFGASFIGEAKDAWLDQEKQNRDQQEQEDKARYRYLLKHTAIALGLGAPLMIWGLLTGEMNVNSSTQQWAWGIVGILTLLVLVISGKHYFTGLWQSLKHRSATMDTLIATGTGTAWLYSMLVVLFPDFFPASARHVYFEASAMIIGLINLGHALELRARGKTSEAIKNLLGLQANSARVIRNKQEMDIPISEVIKGDILRIRPGEKIPVDGLIIEGNSLLDESMLTGEPVPVSKQAGDHLAAGTLNKNGSLLLKAEKVGSETTLAQIISLVKKAQSSKMPIARMADNIAAIFVPTVIAIAVVAALIWLFLGPEPRIAHTLVVFTTVLIIACPCALGLATPMSVITGVGKAAQIGMLVRNGDALQQASNITTVVLDKTGTLTEGSPRVTDIVTTAAFSEANVLTIAASLENSSEHPLAEAIVKSAKEQSLKLHTTTDFYAKTGYGVTGQVEGKTVLLGNQRLMEQQGIITEPVTEQADDFALLGKTPLFIAIDNQLAGLIAVADPIRSDSIAAIARLKAQGLKLVMLTGDNKATAKTVARQAGIDTFYGEVLPEDKDSTITRLQHKGEVVAMAGDGINDAPALARADVSFAMGVGTDVAIESADITLMRSSLHGLADAIELSRATLRNIRQNLLGAFIYNTLGIPVAAGILYPFTGVLLSPVIAGAAMALSSVTVVSNANRLKRFQPSRRQL